MPDTGVFHSPVDPAARCGGVQMHIALALPVHPYDSSTLSFSLFFQYGH